MIKLTLNPEGEPKTERFDLREVIIGNAGSATAHFKLADSHIVDEHVKIIEEEDRFLVINVANDPFTSLNGIPFGKRTLKNHDLIQIGNITVSFEFDEVAVEQENESEQIEETATEESVTEVVEPVGEVATEEKEEVPVEQPRKKYYPKDFHDQPDIVPFPGEEKHKGAEDGNWKMFASIFLVVMILGSVISTGLYFRASGRNSQEEKKIAAGVSDIAMALTHAQINQIAPGKQNYADPVFIQNNLACVLSPNLHTQAQIDNQSQFIRYPYLLRVYTSSNLSRFIVIAQPAPHFFQWLVNKKAVVIDSNSMEIRKIADLKPLNRLLANPDPLDGNNGSEITRVLKEGNLISLKALSGLRNNWGFSPPKTLAMIRPGAENYIYNAPRYYPFGESLLRKAAMMLQSPSGSAEVATLQEEMRELSRFSDLILYTSQGFQSAIEGQKALATFSPHSKFLVGYVKFNTKGYVATSNLLMNEDQGDIALLETNRFDPYSLLDQGGASSFDRLAKELEDVGFESAFSSADPTVDTNHPLYLQLHAVASARTRALAQVGKEMISLIQRQNQVMIPDFYGRLQTLLEEYRQEDLVQQSRMTKELRQLYQEYSEMPLEEFMKFVEALNLATFMQSALKEGDRETSGNLVSKDVIDEQLAAFSSVKSLSSLDDQVQKMIGILNLQTIPDSDRLIVFQEKMRQSVLNSLQDLLLAPSSPYVYTPFNEEDRTTLIRILKASWVTDLDEYEYFLDEFDYLKSLGR